MATQLRPMLAARAEIDQVRYPVLASAKLDGVRALVVGDTLLSRTLKPIPNVYIQCALTSVCPHGLDGELIVGPLTAPDVYRRTVSCVMSQQDPAIEQLTYYVFDDFTYPSMPYKDRWKGQPRVAHVESLPQMLIYGKDELVATWEDMAQQGYEGLILRNPESPYKSGRSTVKEGYMLKLKSFLDDEALVVGFEELYHNANPAQKDERGYTKHSHHQANLVPMDTLGALQVDWHGRSFSIGTGFTQAERDQVWRTQDQYYNKWVKFKYLDVGMKDVPRHPVFLGWRDPLDM